MTQQRRLAWQYTYGPSSRHKLARKKESESKQGHTDTQIAPKINHIIERALTPHVKKDREGDQKTRVRTNYDLVGESFFHGTMCAENVTNGADFKIILFV